MHLPQLLCVLLALGQGWELKHGQLHPTTTGHQATSHQQKYHGCCGQFGRHQPNQIKGQKSICLLKFPWLLKHIWCTGLTITLVHCKVHQENSITSGGTVVDLWLAPSLKENPYHIWVEAPFHCLVLQQCICFHIGYCGEVRRVLLYVPMICEQQELVCDAHEMERMSALPSTECMPQVTFCWMKLSPPTLSSPEPRP